MNKEANIIRAIIVDDELSAHENLRYLLQQYCPTVQIVGEAFHVDEAIILIEETAPELVFLDIEMPNKSGFELFNAIETVSFHTIFVTAYDKHAIRAFTVSAIDYLLKPIAIELLKSAVEKVALKQEAQNFMERMNVFQENNSQPAIRKLSIPYKSDYIIINIEDVLYIEADRMYSIIHIKSNKPQKTFLYAKKLSYFEELLVANENFCRTHRSWIVNLDHVASYSKKEHQLSIHTTTQIPVSKSYKEIVESKLGFSS
jgi:two-component system LytT family response regulator